ncbi:4-coumarate-CoA ligase [Striga asiatica]|uniref:4-coumarate--CoA ligase n=1 Tax=Striga asiatica TaxID=4170 RepID=A0A5A7R4M8_STRAF|nr:4-coumarate-CoA ligase [Striga asiatica]
MESKAYENDNHIFRSKLPDIPIPDHLPVHAYIFQNLHRHPSRPALIDSATGKTLTHSEVELAAGKLAAGLHGRLGIRRGHVIMLLLHNSPEFVISFLAASMAGATVTTANPNYTASEIASQAAVSGPAVVITHSSYAGKVTSSSGARNPIVLTIDSRRFSELEESDERLLPESGGGRSSDTAALLFSSGTTGMPKAVMLSHRNLVACLAQKGGGENPNFHVDGERDVALCVLPLFHVFSLAMVLVVIRAGAAVVIMPRFEVGAVLEAIGRYRVTIAPLVPPALLAIVKSSAAGGGKYDLSTVRKVYSGAAPMGRELEAAVRERLPNAVIGQGYGMTEAGVISISLGFAKKPFGFKSGSCGTVVRNVEMKVIDPLTGASLSRNQKGEICVRGVSIMKGYYNDLEATKRTIDGDGWLHTGDIGYVDDDDELFIVDRLKELIKYKGFHVAPAELEALLIAHPSISDAAVAPAELEALLIAHPSISDAAVVPMKDEAAGEVPVAFVVPTNGSNISEEDIKQKKKHIVVSYKQINRVFFTKEIPRAPSGKILRKNLRSRI